MKRINFKILALMLLTATIFSGCAISKMVKNYDEQVNYTTSTNPLENHGGKVAANVEGTISEGYFARKAIMEVTPVLIHEGGELELPTVTLRGTKTTSPGTMVDQDSSTSFDMNNVMDFQPEMLASELVLRARIYKEGREDRAIALPEEKIADGTINTASRIDKGEFMVAYMADKYEKETIVTEKASIYFDYMRHNFNPRLDLNRNEENQAKITALTDFIKRGWQFKSIEVNAWASPEGEVAFNEELASNRAETGDEYLADLFETIEEETETEIERVDFAVNAKGEDFDGFMAALNASDLPDKQAIANVINAQVAPAERERRIKDMTLIYAEIEKLLAPLRRAEFVVSLYEPKKTDAEMAMLATSNPSELTLEELLYAATLTDDLNTKLAIYKAGQPLFPRCARLFNNAAAVNIELGNIEAAAADLEKANQLVPGNAYIQNNLGVVAAYQDDYDNAVRLFNTANSRDVNTTANVGIINIIQGDYQAASTALATNTCTYNLAMSQLISGNQQAALNTLNCTPESAQVFYLKAIIGARRNDTNLLYDNLRKAIAAEPGYKAIAQKDREFIRFFEQAEFQEIVN
ncbi:MAG: hypothetical protein V2I46_14505 [Bacteroides sp.]|jgi:tetratricopeptide (TPR) repeat protein|nr:hypothetical protein [Bacteroides sp.]